MMVSVMDILLIRLLQDGSIWIEMLLLLERMSLLSRQSSEMLINYRGGGCDVDTKGNRTQTKDHARSDPGVACFVNNIKKGIPVLMIVGKLVQTLVCFKVLRYIQGRTTHIVRQNLYTGTLS